MVLESIFPAQAPPKRRMLQGWVWSTAAVLDRDKPLLLLWQQSGILYADALHETRFWRGLRAKRLTYLKKLTYVRKVCPLKNAAVLFLV